MTAAQAQSKPFYTFAELARLFGVSRWTIRRWLDANRIPYQLRRTEGASRGGRFIVLTSQIRACSPQFYANMRDDFQIVPDRRPRPD